MLTKFHPSSINSGNLFHALCVTSLLALSPVSLFAQPEIPSAQLLFEPVPIPVDGIDENGQAFTSLANLPELVPSAELDDGTIDGATQLRLRAEIEDYATAIGNKESSEGPYSDQLIQDVFSTGQLYQQLEDHELALDFFERARNLLRINEGLDSITQAPMLEAQSESYYALGELTQADETQELLLKIFQDSYGTDSEETVPAIHKMGDWNLNAFLERSNIALNINRDNAANFLANTNYNAVDQTANANVIDDINDPTRTPVFKLYLAQTNYLSAINILLQTKNYSHPDILELERKYLTTAFLRTHQENILYEPDFYLNRKTKATGTRLDTSSQDRQNSTDYDPGLTSLQRSLFYISNNDQRTSLQVAQAMLEEADWHLLFDRKVVARRKYEETYEFFAQYPDMQEQIADYIFSDIPTVLPVFLPAPNSRARLGKSPDEAVQYFGYYDVTFSVTRNGQARRVKIQGEGGEVTKNMELRLKQYLGNVLFRPRYDREGKLNTDDYNLRYYVGL